MAEIKLTKNELRTQQLRLAQLEKYLPTLQLKKAMLQVQVQEARHEVDRLQRVFNDLYAHVESYSALLSVDGGADLSHATKMEKVCRRYENIAGVEVPYFEKIDFAPFTYSLLDTAPWTDIAIADLRRLIEANIAIQIASEKQSALEQELREVSIRVNLFEKILIPRALKNIRKIRIFLGDQQLASVSRAKVAKAKIEERRRVSTRSSYA